MDALQVKRGRPKKLSEETKNLALKRFLCEQQEKEGSLDALQIKYVQEEFSDNMQKMLRVISVTASLPYSLKILPLLNLFEEAAKQFMMSQVELTAVSLILKKLPELTLKITPEELIFLIFFSAKEQVADNEEVIKRLRARLSLQIRGFDETLNKLSPYITVSTKELIKECSTFNLQSIEVNYLYYVDDLLRFCIPYRSHVRTLRKNHKKSRKRKLKKNEEFKLGKQFKVNLKEKQEINELNSQSTRDLRSITKGNRKYRKVKVLNKKIEVQVIDDKVSEKDFRDAVRFNELMPVKVFENALKLDEVLERGMQDYLKFENEGVQDESNETSLNFIQDSTL